MLRREGNRTVVTERPTGMAGSTTGRTARRLALLIALALVTAACAAGGGDLAPGTPDPTGPVATSETPGGRLRVAQEQTGCCYTEGQVSFLSLGGTGMEPIERAYVPGEMVSLLEFFDVTPGTYRLESWQRPCSGSCPDVENGAVVGGTGVLDPGRRDECAAEFSVGNGEVLDLAVRFAPGEGCLIGPPSPPAALALARRTSGEGIFSRAAALKAEVDRRRTAWQAASVDDYAMTVSVACMCEPGARGPYDIVVRDRTVAEVRVDGVVIQPPSWIPVTVEEFFDLAVDDAYSSSIVVEFDPVGYPALIAVNPLLETVDDEVTFSVTSFEPRTGGSS